MVTSCSRPSRLEDLERRRGASLLHAKNAKNHFLVVHCGDSKTLQSPRRYGAVTSPVHARLLLGPLPSIELTRS
jgi:hypothetical protein